MLSFTGTITVTITLHNMRRYANGQVTITQVALEAGVSTQTVSRVINNRPDVSPETRQRVQEIIQRLGYQPNAIARSLIRRRSHTLGVVATGLEYYGPSRTVVGIEQRANELGYSLLLNLLHQPETDNVERLLLGLLARQVDGIIWAVPEIGNNRAWLPRKLSHMSAPVIFLSMQPQANLSVVAVDNWHGGRLATEHLLSQGYRRIGHITGPLDWWEARERRRGWADALTAAGLAAEASCVVEGNWSTGSGERGLRQLLEQCPDIEAVFAGNDQMALGVLQAARRLGRRVPEGLAVVGFDDIPEAAYFWPTLTTVRQELIDLGGTAVQKLAEMIEAKQQGTLEIQPEIVLLQPQLVVRESSTAP